MARKKTQEELYDAFVADVLKRIPTDKRPNIEQILRDEDFATSAREGVLARSDYNRNMDELREAREQLEREAAEARDRIAGWTDWYQNVSQETASMAEQIRAYEAKYGTLDVDTRRALRNDNPGFLTKEAFDAALASELAKRDASAIAVADVLTDLKIQHRQDFNERLDTKSLIDIATKRDVPLDVAYDQLVADRREEKRRQDFDVQIAKAREEGAREALSKHHLPVVPGNTSPHPLDNVNKVPSGVVGQPDRVRAAVADWNTSDHSS